MKPTLPTGPSSALPQLVHASDPFPYMLKLARKYGDPLTCPLLGGPPIVLTWSPEGARAIFTADPDTFVPTGAEALAVIVGKGSLFLASDRAHKRARKLLAPPFHGQRMRSYGAAMQRATERWALELVRGRSAPILATAQGVTLDVIIEAIFGERDESKIHELHADILAVVAAFGPLIATFTFMQREFWGFGPWAKFRRRADALRTKIRVLIEDKRAQPGEDILSLLISARDEDGEPLSDQEIFEQLLTFVVAGHETTATTLAWAMYELHRQPALLSRLRDELASLGDAPAPDALAKLPYLTAVCNETLRLHPPLPIVQRGCAREFTLGEYTVPAGTRLGVAIYLAHHRASCFEEPDRFRPERFLERTYTPFEFMPFGGGARRCLGAAFAMYELQIVLATLLAGRVFELDEPKPVGNEFRIGVYGPRHGVRMTLARASA